MSHLAVPNFDVMFENLTFEPILINKVVCYTQNDRKELNKQLMTVYETDSISSVPQCECGELYGQYNVGIICSVCGTKCRDAFDFEMQSRVWMQVLPGIKAFIAPHWWWRLSADYIYQGFNMIKWLCDPIYKPSIEKIDKAVLIETYFKDKGFSRDLNFFHDNFDVIMELLTFNGLHDNPNYPIRKSAYNQTNRSRVELYEFIMKNRDTVFCQYLPIPDKTLFIIETNDTGSYGDIHMEYAINAVKIIQQSQQDIGSLSFRSICHRMVKVIDDLTMFYDKYLERNYYKKKANFRQHVYGGRLHFTGRAVISSITGPHQYDELYVPWGFAVHLLKLHVISKLIKRGYGLYEINDLIRVASYHPHPIVREIFDELISESPHKGIPVIFQRNPTLHRGSGQLLYITRIKDEIEDHTISISVLTISAMNADFDGDELNVTLLLDQKRWENFKNLEPHHNIMSATDPYELSDILKVQPQIVATALNWMNVKRLEREQNAIKSD